MKFTKILLSGNYRSCVPRIRKRKIYFYSNSSTVLPEIAVKFEEEKKLVYMEIFDNHKSLLFRRQTSSISSHLLPVDCDLLLLSNPPGPLPGQGVHIFTSPTCRWLPASPVQSSRPSPWPGCPYLHISYL